MSERAGSKGDKGDKGDKGRRGTSKQHLSKEPASKKMAARRSLATKGLPEGGEQVVRERAERRTTERSMVREAFVTRGVELVKKMAEVAPESLLATALGKRTALDTMATAMAALVATERSFDPDDEVFAAARAQGALQMKQLLERAGGAYSAEQLARILGKAGGRATIAAGRKSNIYFGLPTSSGYAYPKLQVATGGWILPGLRAFLDAFTLPDSWMKLVVLLEPSPRLGGRSPLEALHAGDTDLAVQVASAYGLHGA